MEELKSLFYKKSVYLAILFEIFYVFGSLPNYNKVFPYIMYVLAICIFLYTIPVIFSDRSSSLNKYVRWFLILYIFGDLIMPKIYWNQSYLGSLQMIITFLPGWCIFFFLIKKRYPLKIIEDALIIAIILNGIIYSISFRSFVSSNQLYNAETSELRYWFGDYAFQAVVFFILLNRYIVKRKYIYLILLLFPSVMLFLTQTRQILVIIPLVGFFYIYRRLSMRSLVGILISILLLFSYAKPYIDGLLEKTQNQLQNDDTNTGLVRIYEYKYYFKDHSKEIPQILFGNGINEGNSPYSSYLLTHAPGPVADAGYAGIYAYWGMVGLLLFGMFFLKVILKKTSDDNKWLFYSMIALYLLNVMSFTLRSGVIGILLYGYACNYFSKRSIIYKPKN